MDQGMGVMYGFSIVAILFQLLYLVCIGLGIYGLVLFIKLARRGITALEIYIGKHRDPNQRMDQNNRV
ncbi:hypothetical protein [Paenibacillus sp. Marseille-Q4541]|uniref:hypothetical protein n=1 Tax=Paenibacillus sp. Marseille-Q4541 TaxID=2831522 RepID=UPI0020198F86|nr:hypothetical protein [Paenibacillus sp. Marseille-Q4541]